MPGSNQRYDEAQLGDLFAAIDWFPRRHPEAPRIVLVGHRPDAMACGFCHLPDGQGRPENAALAGLPAAYIIEQIQSFRSGDRSGADPSWRPTQLMRRVAAGVTPAESQDAARYFSQLKYAKAFRIVATRDIPTVTPLLGLYGVSAGGAREPLGQRIIETPNVVARFELRDNRPGYTIYVPEGALARGRLLARGGSNGVPACASCHGAGLRGAVGPPIAGRYPAYVYRQLLGFSSGARAGPQAAPMVAVARAMRPGDRVDLAAYVASLEP